MNKTVLWVLVVGVILSGVYLYYKQGRLFKVDGDQMMTTNNEESMMEDESAMEEDADLIKDNDMMEGGMMAGDMVMFEQNDSGMTGKFSLEEADGKVKVSVSTTGFSADVQQPAHIHSGTCDDIGGVVYPLTSVVNGQSTTVIDASLDDLKSQLPLALNVHKSATEIGVYVSCGDLEF